MRIDLPAVRRVLDAGKVAMLCEKGQIGGGLARGVKIVNQLAGCGVTAPDAYGFSTFGASDRERGVTVGGEVGHGGNL
nr:hypothetical protein [Roseinatronobacter monicus]